MSSALPLIEVAIRQRTQPCALVCALELVAADGGVLPPFTAGAHIDLHLPNGLLRSYSLLGDPADTGAYHVAIRRDETGRGGSRYIHEQLQAGQRLHISAPRNAFALDESASHSLLLAGGIGITPLLSMAHRLTALGKPWQMVYCGRQREHLAFVEHVQALADAAGAPLVLHIDQDGGGPINLPQLLASQPAGTHAYCCGPAPMLEAYRQAGQALAGLQLHWEYFAPAAVAHQPNDAFDVVLKRSGQHLHVPAQSTLLDVLLDTGIEVDYGCMEGVCGACRTGVLAGTPDHRDFVLSEAEKKAGDCIMLCCSRSRSPVLELDL